MDQFSIPGALHAPVAARPHLLDITMFWSPRSGGVARYLRSKRDWLNAHSNWRHTIMAPGPSTPETETSLGSSAAAGQAATGFPCGALPRRAPLFINNPI